MIAIQWTFTDSKGSLLSLCSSHLGETARFCSVSFLPGLIPKDFWCNSNSEGDLNPFFLTLATFWITPNEANSSVEIAEQFVRLTRDNILLWMMFSSNQKKTQQKKCHYVKIDAHIIFILTIKQQKKRALTSFSPLWPNRLSTRDRTGQQLDLWITSPTPISSFISLQPTVWLTPAGWLKGPHFLLSTAFQKTQFYNFLI